MSLIALKHHMCKVRMATLTSLCSLFGADPDTMRCFLRHWMQKGKIRECQKKPACGTQCFKCPAASLEWYEWVDYPANQVVSPIICS